MNLSVSGVVARRSSFPAQGFNDLFLLPITINQNEYRMDFLLKNTAKGK